MVESKWQGNILFRVVNSNTVAKATYLVFFFLSVQGGEDITHEPVCEQEI